MDRQLATRKIERIVGAIEGGKFPAAIRTLYVFGSYARGALRTCPRTTPCFAYADVSCSSIVGRPRDESIR
jgi:hypothetical protein